MEDKRGTDERQTTEQAPAPNPRGRGALSPEIRRLLLNYGVDDSEPTWDPDAFARRLRGDSASRAA